MKRKVDPKFVMRETCQFSALNREASGLWKEGNEFSVRNTRFTQTLATAGC